MPNLSGTPRAGKSSVRQVKGPGMNQGMKKPRKNFIPKPKPYKMSKELKTSTAGGKASSYLPSFEEGGSVQAMDSGKGKQLSCKKY